MKCREIMTEDPACCLPSDTVHDVFSLSSFATTHKSVDAHHFTPANRAGFDGTSIARSYGY
jgi:hypothetical protein